MIPSGKLRVLSADDPNPYPDTITVDLDEPPESDGTEDCTVSRKKRYKGKTAIEKALGR